MPTDLATMGDWLAVVQPQAVILTGGENIGEDPQRDAMERWVLEELCGKIPILGICRGAQVINVWRGGQLMKTGLAHHAGTRHEIRVRSGVLETRETGWIESDVNSYHWNTIAEEDLGEGLLSVALHSDGTVEAFQDESAFLLATMWHPERERDTDARLDTWLAGHLTQKGGG